MRPVRTANSNLVYVGPPGVGDLHCQRIEPGHIRSIWYLTAEERRLIAAGANVGLDVLTEPVPPVSLFVTDEQGVGDDDPAVLRRLVELMALPA